MTRELLGLLAILAGIALLTVAIVNVGWWSFGVLGGAGLVGVGVAAAFRRDSVESGVDESGIGAP